MQCFHCRRLEQSIDLRGNVEHALFKIGPWACLVGEPLVQGHVLHQVPVGIVHVFGGVGEPLQVLDDFF